MPVVSPNSAVTFTIQPDQEVIVTAVSSDAVITLGSQPGGDVVFDLAGRTFKDAVVVPKGRIGTVTVRTGLAPLSYELTRSSFLTVEPNPLTGKMEILDPETGLPIAAGGYKQGAFTGLPVFKAALQATLSGVSDTNVLFIGDSTRRGVGSGDGAGTSRFPNSVVNAIAESWPHSPAASQNILGQAGIVLATYDSRVNMGGWTNSAASIGGNSFFANSAVADLVLTPNGTFSKVDVYYLTTPGAGSFGVKIDGSGIFQTVSCNAANSVKKISMTVPLGAHTVAFSWVSGNAIVLGIDAWDGRNKVVKFINGGISGAKTGDMIDISVAYSYLNSLGAVTPSLIDIDLGINDLVNSIPVATYKANLTTIANAAKATGADVTISTPNPVGAGDLTPYVAACAEVATSTGAKLLDFWTAVGGTKASWGNQYYFDNYHPNYLGNLSRSGYWLSQVAA